MFQSLCSSVKRIVHSQFDLHLCDHNGCICIFDVIFYLSVALLGYTALVFAMASDIYS